jgi:hypothetical protein
MAPDAHPYRWERLGLAQQQVAWEMVEHMRVTVRRERMAGA